MQRYKLIELKTRKEHLCDKVTIDGFDYYVSDKKEQVVLNKYYYEYDNHVPIYSFTKQTLPNQYYLSQVISTNNPNIDIPKVVDEVEILAEKFIGCKYEDIEDSVDQIGYDSFKRGYNKSQETHPFSEEDMIEFADWVDNMGYTQVANGLYKSLSDEKGKLTKELLQLWKEQRPKIVYIS